MPACPGCHGEGSLDMRDDDALLGELMSDAELARAREAGMVHPCGVVECGECEGTGVVSAARALDMAAAARAHVDQAIARVASEQRMELDSGEERREGR